MEKIWLKSYPKGVPAEINPDIYQSIVELFESSCKMHSHQPAYYNLGVTISYAELELYARDFAAFLQDALKLKKGTRFAIMMPNVLQYPIAIFAALRAGLIVVNTNPLYTADELIYQLNDAQAEAIIVLANFADTVEQALPKVPTLKHVIITQLGDLFPPIKAMVTYLALKYIYKKIPRYTIPHAVTFHHALKTGKKMIYTPVPINNEDIAFLQYTGGTTGISKGAMLTHRNLIANMTQADTWFTGTLTGKNEIIITALPLYHIFSLTANCLYFSQIGGLNVLITNPRDTPQMIKEMRKFKFTAITGVNTLFNSLLKNPQFSQLDFSRLLLALGGGMAIQRVVSENWEAITKSPLVEAYGLTETSPCLTINLPGRMGYTGSVGLPVPSTDVCILDNEGVEVPIGEVGELAVKGPQVMQGYWHNDAETAKVFTKDGWLLTGDYCSIDERGFIYLKERKKDMIIVSGFNVYPNEIEDVIAKYKGVREVAVIGVDDPNSGEAVKAFIVKDEPSISSEDIIKYCHLHLTPYKIPKQIVFAKDLPKTNVGKILRRALKEKVA